MADDDRVAGPTHGPMPTEANLLAPQVARFDLPSSYGAHTAFPVVAGRPFVVVVNELFQSANNDAGVARYFIFDDGNTDHAEVAVSDHQIRALLNQVRGVALAMQAARAVNPDARLVQTDDLGKTHATPA